MYSILPKIDNISLKLCEAAGLTVEAELKMRLIGELSEEIRNVIDEIIKNKIEERKRKDSGYKYTKGRKYWNCDLEILDEAILQVFADKLTMQEKKQLEAFRQKRNKFLHANFVGLMKLIGIEPIGRYISSNGDRNILDTENIIDSIVSIDNNGGFEAFRCAAGGVNLILNKLVELCENKNQR